MLARFSFNRTLKTQPQILTLPNSLIKLRPIKRKNFPSFPVYCLRFLQKLKCYESLFLIIPERNDRVRNVLSKHQQKPSSLRRLKLRTQFKHRQTFMSHFDLCSHFTSTENTGKPRFFCCFQGI